jgi:hypothetical protein
MTVVQAKEVQAMRKFRVAWEGFVAVCVAVVSSVVLSVAAFAQATPDYSGLDSAISSSVSSAQSGISGIAPVLVGLVAFVAVLLLALRLLSSALGGGLGSGDGPHEWDDFE